MSDIERVFRVLSIQLVEICLANITTNTKKTLIKHSKSLRKKCFSNPNHLSINVHLPILTMNVHKRKINLVPYKPLSPICAYLRFYVNSLGSASPGWLRIVWTRVISIFLTRPICVRLLISPSIPHQSQSPQ